MRSQLAGKFWIDTGRAEQLAAIGERLLERALDGVGPDEHLGDFVLIGFESRATLVLSGIGIEELLCRRWSPIAVPRSE